VTGTVEIQRIFDDIATHWQIVLVMPLFAAVTGYVTKRVAIEMMFRPMEFVGINRLFGWQGVVPRNAERMAVTAARLLTSRLVDAREIFARIDADRLTREIQGPLLAAVDEITREVLAQHHPRLWEMLPALARDVVVKQVQAGAPDMIRQLMHELRDNVHDVIDVEDLAISALRRDKNMLVRLVRDISRPEMEFIARSGIYSGFALGLVQTGVWAITREPIVLPLFGMVIGWLTDWLAIRLVFLPRERRMLFGLVPFQGIFQRRRDEVAHEYGRLIAEEVLTVPNIVDAVLRGPRSDRIVEMVERTVSDAVDTRVSIARPVVSVAIGPRLLAEMKRAAAARAMDYIADTVQHAAGYLTATMDIGNTIATRMRDLSRVEYEALLRPAFRQEEPKLVAVGAIIGFLVGELQVLLLLG
jgi:uncharacterized membrane protein YheB (UPF0754 family)